MASSQARFCSSCGERLAVSVAGEGAAADRGEAERRLVTVVFCDLVGSTALSNRLDPEDLRALVSAYHELCAGEIARFGGWVKQYLGDGVLAYFGYPQALENDALGAVRAGLGVVERLRQLNQRRGLLRGERLSVRVAIHTGLSVAGEMGPAGHREPTVVGATPNVAAHLQRLARPDTVVVSEATHRLIHGFFHCRDLGPKEIKGVTAPVRLYEVGAWSGAESRLDAAVERGLTPLVGREREVALLLDRWQRVEQGEGQAVLVRGEAGIGKSRLLLELRDRLTERNIARLECRCSAHHQNSALYPVIDLLQHQWGLTPEAPAGERREKLERAVEQLSLNEEAFLLLASLLSVPLPEDRARLEMSSQRQKQRTLDVLLEILRGAASWRPILLVIEDLHWIDPSTLELLGLLLGALSDMRVLALLSFRPSFHPPWSSGQTVSKVTLDRLTAEQSREMSEIVAGGRVLPEEVLRELRDKSDGVPLYVEELTKMVLESGMLRESEGDRPGQRLSFAIPSTLQESLMARLDRLVPVKEVLQVGAVLGRSFPYRLLQAVSSLDPGTLQNELERLVDADVLRQDGTFPQCTYSFKHALIQEAAYELLLKSRRQDFHRRAARAYEEELPQTAGSQPELLAHHYAEAGMSQRAADFYLRAGERALESSADLEAVRHLRKGLQLVEALPDSLEQELALRTSLGVALMSTKGYAAPEVEENYTRARELCGRAGESRQVFSALAGLGYYHQSRAELEAALELAEQRLRLARKLDDRELEMQAHEGSGTVSFWMGRFSTANEHLRLGDAIYDFDVHRPLARVYGQDLGVVFRAYRAQVLWFLGWCDDAIGTAHDAVELARRVSHPNSLALALDFAAALHVVRREPQRAREFADSAIALAREQQFPFWLSYGTIIRGYALALDGKPKEGAEQLVAGMSSWQGTGAQLGGRFCISLLADALRLAGEVEEGLALLDGALGLLERNEDRFWDAEVERVRGELLLAGSTASPVEAEACFRRALATSRRQQARILELRAATSLARLLQRRGEARQARTILAPLHQGFSQGFDTLDLKEARESMDALA